MRDDPAGLSGCAMTRIASHPAMRFGMEQSDRRFVTLYPRRFFGSVCALWPVAAIRLSSVSTRLLKVRFSCSASALSRAFSSASIRMFRFTFAMLQPPIEYVKVAA